MKLINIKFLLVLLIFLSACGETEKNPKEIQEPEPVDVQATEQLGNKLLYSMQSMSESQTIKEEGASKQSLEKLSEADRQAIIDLTIEQSADEIEQDAIEVLEHLERSAQ